MHRCYTSNSKCHSCPSACAAYTRFVNGFWPVQAPVDEDLAAQQAVPPAKMTVPQLKEQLKTFNMPVSGKKAELVHRLETALSAAAAVGHASQAAAPNSHVGSDGAGPSAVPASDAVESPLEPKAAGSHHASGGEDMSPAQTAGSASQQSMTSLEVAALNDDKQTSVSGAHEGDGEALGGVAGVQPGSEGLGEVGSLEVRMLSDYQTLSLY